MSTAGDEGQGGWFGAKEVRNRILSLAAIFVLFLFFLFYFILVSLIFPIMYVMFYCIVFFYYVKG